MIDHRFVTVRGCRYHVQTVGEGAPATLLLHGFTGSADVWASFTEDFPTPGQRVAVDLLGHGRTDAPASPVRYSMSETIADLAALMTELGHETFDLIGYSMGGRIALAFALTHPERVQRLLLESASPGLRTEAERAMRRQSDAALADLILQQGMPAFVDRWEQTPLFASQARLAPEVLERQRVVRLSHQPIGLANSLLGIGTGSQPSYWDELHTLQLPVLLVTGELDEKYTAIAEAMLTILPNARHADVPGAGHTVHLEEPDLYRGILVGFLSGRAVS